MEKNDDQEINNNNNDNEDEEENIFICMMEKCQLYKKRIEDVSEHKQEHENNKD